MEHEVIFDRIRKEFCMLFSFKPHGEALEVITPLCTITDKFVSVFVLKRGNDLIVTDGGWIADNIYDQPEYEKDDKATIDLISNQYKEHFQVTISHAADRHDHYYKKTQKIELLSACVFDVASYVQAAVNTQSVAYREQKEKHQRDRFTGDANKFLRNTYRSAFKSRYKLTESVMLDAVIEIGDKIHLFEYISGSNKGYFDDDVRKATVNFQLSQSIGKNMQIGNRIALVNDQSTGYAFGYDSILIEHLEKFTTRACMKRTEIGILTSIIKPE